MYIFVLPDKGTAGKDKSKSPIAKPPKDKQNFITEESSKQYSW